MGDASLEVEPEVDATGETGVLGDEATVAGDLLAWTINPPREGPAMTSPPIVSLLLAAAKSTSLLSTRTASRDDKDVPDTAFLDGLTPAPRLELPVQRFACSPSLEADLSRPDDSPLDPLEGPRLRVRSMEANAETGFDGGGGGEGELPEVGELRGRVKGGILRRAKVSMRAPPQPLLTPNASYTKLTHLGAVDGRSGSQSHFSWQPCGKTRVSTPIDSFSASCHRHRQPPPPSSTLPNPEQHLPPLQSQVPRFCSFPVSLPPRFSRSYPSQELPRGRRKNAPRWPRKLLRTSTPNERTFPDDDHPKSPSREGSDVPIWEGEVRGGRREPLGWRFWE